MTVRQPRQERWLIAVGDVPRYLTTLRAEAVRWLEDQRGLGDTEVYGLWRWDGEQFEEVPW